MDTPAAPAGTTSAAPQASVRITLKLMATLTDYLPQPRQGHQMALDIMPGATVQDVVERFRLPWKLVHLVLVDGVYIDPDKRDSRILQEGETLAIWPPVAGG
ncbi:MAG: MoaD/ThiS family protein [Thiomonas sp.]|nr:MoaD/ThiS family protein [Thiomonas sp.]